MDTCACSNPESIAGILKTIYLFLAGQNFQQTCETFLLESQNMGMANFKSAIARILILKPSFTEVVKLSHANPTPEDHQQVPSGFPRQSGSSAPAQAAYYFAQTFCTNHLDSSVSAPTLRCPCSGASECQKSEFTLVETREDTHSSATKHRMLTQSVEEVEDEVSPRSTSVKSSHVSAVHERVSGQKLSNVSGHPIVQIGAVTSSHHSPQPSAHSGVVVDSPHVSPPPSVHSGVVSSPHPSVHNVYSVHVSPHPSVHSSPHPSGILSSSHASAHPDKHSGVVSYSHASVHPDDHNKTSHVSMAEGRECMKEVSSQASKASRSHGVQHTDGTSNSSFASAVRFENGRVIEVPGVVCVDETCPDRRELAEVAEEDVCGKCIDEQGTANIKVCLKNRAEGGETCAASCTADVEQFARSISATPVMTTRSVPTISAGPPLDYGKIKGELRFGCPVARIGLLQALRWRITFADEHFLREVMTDYARHDILSLHGTPANEAKTFVEEFLYPNPGEPTLQVQQEGMARMLNAMASLTVGRDYLCQDETMLTSLILPLVMDTHPAKLPLNDLTREYLLAVLQKLSLRNNMRLVMIDAGFAEFLVHYLSEHKEMSDYSLEYTLALFMNLCLHNESHVKLRKKAKEVVKFLGNFMVGCKHLSYINGAMYSLFMEPDIIKEARHQRLDSKIVEKSRTVCDEIKQQFDVILDILRSNEKHGPPAVQCDCIDHETEIDNLEEEIETGDMFNCNPQGEELLSLFELESPPKESKTTPLTCICRPVTPNKKITAAEFCPHRGGEEENLQQHISDESIDRENKSCCFASCKKVKKSASETSQMSENYEPSERSMPGACPHPEECCYRTDDDIPTKDTSCYAVCPRRGSASKQPSANSIHSSNGRRMSQQSPPRSPGHSATSYQAIGTSREIREFSPKTSPRTSHISRQSKTSHGSVTLSPPRGSKTSNLSGPHKTSPRDSHNSPRKGSVTSDASAQRSASSPRDSYNLACPPRSSVTSGSSGSSGHSGTRSQTSKDPASAKSSCYRGAVPGNKSTHESYGKSHKAVSRPIHSVQEEQAYYERADEGAYLERDDESPIDTSEVASCRSTATSELRSPPRVKSKNRSLPSFSRAAVPGQQKNDYSMPTQSYCRLVPCSMTPCPPCPPDPCQYMPSQCVPSCMLPVCYRDENGYYSMPCPNVAPPCAQPRYTQCPPCKGSRKASFCARK